MFDKEFLKTLTVMYVEDDTSIRESLGAIFQKVFKDVIMCVDGQDGLEKYKLYTTDLGIEIDAVVSDINMPKLNGLQMLSKIREFDIDVPAIMTTAHGETDFLMEAIRVNVSYYALKPINTPDLLANIQKFCLAKHQQKLISRKEKELSSYIDIIDQVATVAKINNEGNFIEVNDLFCEVSLYDKNNITNRSITEMTHPDIISSVYTTMQKTLKNGQTWEGLYKCIDNNNDTFYLRVSAIPEFNDSNNEMQGYIMVGFIATEDEQEKRDTMQKVRHNIIEHKQKEGKLKSKIRQLETTKRTLEYKQKNTKDVSFIEGSLEKNKIKIVSLLNQIAYYEKEITQLKDKLNGIAEAEISKRQDLMKRNKILQKENEVLKEKVITLQGKVIKLEKRKR